MNNSLIKNRRWLIAACHATVTALSLAAALQLRFDFMIPEPYKRVIFHAILMALPLKLLIFHCAGLHQGWWRFAGIMDLWRVLVANLAASATLAVLGIWAFGTALPRSVYFIDFLICFLVSAGIRFAVRIYYEAVMVEIASKGEKGILIFGAGAAGRALLREIRSNPSLGYDVLGFIDDDPRLASSRIMAAPVLGAGRNLPLIVERLREQPRRLEEVIIAMPSATGRQIREALACCRSAGIACKIMPGFSDILKGKYLITQIREASLEDLLGRDPVRIDEGRVHETLEERTVLVTGAAGSIGSELCRQIARFKPARIVAFDMAESALYALDLEMRRHFPNLDLVPELGDLRDARRVEEIIRRHCVSQIFHAAAYKHVPMMEAHPLEAVQTNILGTWNLLRSACRNHVSNFLMISSDKAVNPTSIMGATKRAAELIISAASNGFGNGTRFASVRFGNVLGSNGSVVPVFRSQIAAGGPVTITHPEMRRYFMSVREAVQLVLQASTMGKGSEIFVLEMGEPVRIMDLAHNMIRLAGMVPGEDIEVRIVGLRPGEKLNEELMNNSEDVLPTPCDKIKIFKGPCVGQKAVLRWLDQLSLLVAKRDPRDIYQHLKALIPEYQPDSREPRAHNSVTQIPSARNGYPNHGDAYALDAPAAAS